MANSYLVIQVKFDTATIEKVKGYIPTSSNEHTPVARGMGRLFEAISAGVVDADVIYALGKSTGETAATGSIVCTQANAAGNYVRFTSHGVAVTLTEGTDFARGASDTTCGAALATAINAHATLSRIMSASASTGTVTVTGRMKGILPHAITIATDDGTAFALTQFASGVMSTDGTFLMSTKYGNSL